MVKTFGFFAIQKNDTIGKGYKMNKDLVAIFEYMEREKGINREIIISAIEDSLCLAAKKSFQGES